MSGPDADRSPAAAWQPDVPEIRDGRDLIHLIGHTAEIADHLSAAASKLGAPDRPELFDTLVRWRDAVEDWLQVSEVLDQAERATVHADYRRHVALALAELARRPGLAWTRLYPERQRTSTYLVALDGRELGTVTPWRSSFVGGRRRTLTWQARVANWRTTDELQLGPYRSIGEAARALAARDQGPKGGGAA
jgi:hypothetical protein